MSPHLQNRTITRTEFETFRVVLRDSKLIQNPTHSENTKHAFNTGLVYSKKGSKANNVRLTEEKVIHIRKGELKIKEYMKLYNVSYGCVQGVLYRTTWRHI